MAPLSPRRFQMALCLAAHVTLLSVGSGCTEPRAQAERVPVSEGALAPEAKLPPPAVARARLTKLSGDVQVKRATADAWAAGNDDMELFENDKVRTVAGASAQVVFANGSHVTLGENSLVSIAETRTRPGEDPTDLTVLEGRIDAELVDPDKSSLTVTTPAATVRAGREIVFQ